MIGCSKGNRRAAFRAMRHNYWGPVPADAPITHVLDVGAHVGMFATWARMRWPHAQIVSVEADPVTFESLRSNVENLEITPVHAAFGRGKIALTGPNRDSCSRKYRPVENPPPDALDGQSLADLCRLFGQPPQKLLIKVDVEGAEHAMQADPALGLDVLQLAMAVAIEVHEPHNGFGCWLASELVPTHKVAVVARHRDLTPNVIHAVRKDFV
jgi:FkbM family methyltransferase